MENSNSNIIKLSQVLLSFSRAISMTLGMGLFHTLQIAKIAYIIGKHLSLNKKQLELLVISALLHDIRISSIKKNFTKIDNDIIEEKDFDILELLNLAKTTNSSEITDLLLTHSLEGAQFLKQSAIKDRLYEIFKKDVQKKDSTETLDPVLMSKILAVSDLLECATTIEETLEEKAAVATKLIQNFSDMFLDKPLSEKIYNIVKEKEFWYATVNQRLFDELFQEFDDEVYSLYSKEAIKFFELFALFIDIKSPHTAKHSTNIAKISKLLAKELNLPKENLSLIYLAGLIHDIGKLAISNAILEKPDKLTKDEYATMKLHPKITKEILKPMKNVHELIAWGAHHHERINGSGYPLGITNEEIPMESKIIAVADVYDALSADRPYRKGMKQEIAFKIIKQDSGVLFDQECVNALERILPKVALLYTANEVI